MSSKVGMCTGGRKPPELSSMPVRPSLAITSIASGSDRSCRSRCKPRTSSRDLRSLWRYLDRCAVVGG